MSSDIVLPRLLEVVKGIIKDYSFKDISSKHDDIKKVTLTKANLVLNEIGIQLQDINILDIRLPKDYLQSQEDLLKAENELALEKAKSEKQKQEADRLLNEAKTDSEIEKIRAQNDKEVKILEAESIAEYNRIINEQTITEELLKLKGLENQIKKIEKWDGQLPTTINGNSQW